IAAWLHAKHMRSGRAETRAAYAHTIAQFRTVVRAQGLDLDAADPRRLRAALGTSAATGTAALEDAAAERATGLAVMSQAFAARPGRHGGARTSSSRAARLAQLVEEAGDEEGAEGAEDAERGAEDAERAAEDAERAAEDAERAADDAVHTGDRRDR